MISGLETYLQEHRKWVWFVLLVAGLLVTCPRLGNMVLWQDEAESALLGRSVLREGFPKAWDGVNLISQQKGRDFREGYLWIWHSWLQYYVIAISFGLLGESEVSARLPFALIGILCLPLLYEYGRTVTGRNGTSLLACALLLLSVPFLLHARQCRWYTLPIFFFLLTLIAYDRLHKRLPWSRPFLFVSLTFFFHSFYPSSLCVFLALLLHSLTLRRWRENSKLDLAWLGLWLLSVIPWCVFTRIFARGDSFESLWQTITFAKWYLLALNEGVMPIILWPLIVWMRTKGKAPYRTLAMGAATLGILMSLSHYPGHARDFVLLFSILGTLGGYILIVYLKKVKTRRDSMDYDAWHGLIVMAILLPLVWMPRNNFRYLLPLLPLASLFLAQTFTELWSRNRPATVLMSFLFLGSNGLSWGPLKIASLLSPAAVFYKDHSLFGPPPYPLYEMGLNMGVRFPLVAYFQELTHDFEGPNEAIVDFFQTYARKDDTILTNYEDLPLMFYTDCQVLGGLSGHGWDEEDLDWIIIRQHWFNVDYLAERALEREFMPLWLPVRDLRWGNRPLPSYHLFRSPDPPTKRNEGVLILGPRDRIEAIKLLREAHDLAPDRSFQSLLLREPGSGTSIRIGTEADKPRNSTWHGGRMRNGGCRFDRRMCSPTPRDHGKKGSAWIPFDSLARPHGSGRPRGESLFPAAFQEPQDIRRFQVWTVVSG